jgi:hypothetical protein
MRITDLCGRVSRDRLRGRIARELLRRVVRARRDSDGQNLTLVRTNGSAAWAPPDSTLACGFEPHPPHVVARAQHVSDHQTAAQTDSLMCSPTQSDP